MNFLSSAKKSAVQAYRTDPNLNRVKGWVAPVCQRLPSATIEYITEKLPVAHWLPHYQYKWLLQDVIAGITIGVMLIPQGLAYAKIATIPVEHGLYSSWVPSALYFFLGTSKEVSSGPTSILGLLTAETVAELSHEGYGPAQIASAIAFMVGVYSLAVGLLKLGFLLDFVSGPVLSGWISAVAIVIGLGQVGSLVGLETGSGTANIIRDVLGHLNRIKPMTLCIGFTSIAMLYSLEFIGKKWGKRNQWIKFASTSRAVIVLIIYTLISYLVNHDRSVKNYAWDVTKVNTNGLLTPRTHDNALLQKIIPRAFAPFIAMAVEHLGVGKAFGLRNNYNIDKSQELVFLGASNMINSLFGAQACGGAMSRTAVNSECGVKSPVNFLLTASFIILTLYKLAPALYWIPKATLSAIIIMAVVHLVSSPRIFYRYWRVSFIDFVASMLGLWVTLFTSTEIGLAVAVGFSIVYTLLRLAFPTWSGFSHHDTENIHWSMSRSGTGSNEIDVPAEGYLVRFTDDILFPNAERVKNGIIESVKVNFEPDSSLVQATNGGERSWNVFNSKKIAQIRKRKNIIPFQADIAPLRFVVLDFAMVGFIDVTGVQSVSELKGELRRYMGTSLQFRFVNMAGPVKERFDRAEWPFAYECQERGETTDVIFSSLEAALHRDERESRSDIIKEEKTSQV